MKKPRPDGGVFLGSMMAESYCARRSEAPETGAFFDNAAMQGFAIIRE
jgi:hypothetical protein